MSGAAVPWSRFNFEIESRLDAVPLLGQLAYLLCTAAGFEPVEVSQLEVCVVEAINNSILHAYHGEPGHRVELEARLLPGQLIFDVWDSGSPADPVKMNADHRSALEVHSKGVKDIPHSGRGLGIIQEVMDSSVYTPGRERNRFQMIKHRDSHQLSEAWQKRTRQLDH
jgi:serine/threonine-protein kinase RsbW